VTRAVWLAGAAALLPLAAAALAETPPNQTAFTPPSTPMLLTRTLRRALPDGKAVVTRRSYRVRFVREGAGFRLDGALVDVRVEALPGLEPLAQLERQRPDTGLFPMRLDARGMLLPTTEPAPSEAEHKALNVATGYVAALNLASADSAQAQRFVAQFQTRAYRTAWPQDLFHPVPGTRREQQTIPLPDGVEGTVTTEVAVTTGAAGLLNDFKRVVTTRLGNDTRVAQEEWTLEPAPISSSLPDQPGR
jgi:hypothetical protein